MKVIALAGNARCGKDSMCAVLTKILDGQNHNVKRIAFADAVKSETDVFLKETVGISAYTSDTSEKDIIRPFLVFWGTDFRRKHDDACWLKLAEKEMDPDAINIITDLRFENEREFIQDKLKGKVIYIERQLNDSFIVPPGHPYEADNNPALKDKADHVVAWPTLDSFDDMVSWVDKNVPLFL